MTTISIRLKDDEKKELEEMCADMGMNISTFYLIYTKKALRDRRIPFDIEAPYDPFYSEMNQAYLRKADHQVKTGHVIEKTMEELEAMEVE
ncbi:MAG: type II toxin-antitoxin system RelB/DinJ family antitoxin [Lachnospiraceae bacterium]|nr:type II toxin-antitoxin system RelB/DinJ family antitoxin [Lachnospiraceae bacterium]